MTAAPLTLLVVDDNPIDREAVRRALRRHRVPSTIVDAEDAATALALLRADGAALPRPCVVLLDLNLPRVSGLELLARIRADPTVADTVVLVWTTSRREEDMAAAHAHGVADYVVKDALDDHLDGLVELLVSYTAAVPPGTR